MTRVLIPLVLMILYARLATDPTDAARGVYAVVAQAFAITTVVVWWRARGRTTTY